MKYFKDAMQRGDGARADEAADSNAVAVAAVNTFPKKSSDDNDDDWLLALLSSLSGAVPFE